jgi:hypothetical protein
MESEGILHRDAGGFERKRFHEKAGRSQVKSFVFLLDKVFSKPRSHCRHASIRTLEERFIRSVQVGRSRFSRCCYLIGDLSFHLRVERGPGD